MKYRIVIFCITCFYGSFAQKNSSVSFEKWISLKSVNSPIISPDGKIVVYSVNSTDWANNSYDSELWMWKEGMEPVQLTRTEKGSSTAAAFTPDSKFVSFLADRGDKTQIYLISVNGGEAVQVTKDEDGINTYEWSPDGTKILYSKPDVENKKNKTIKERFGGFAVEGQEFRQTHLWLLNFSYDSILLAGQTPCYTSKKDSTGKDSLVKSKTQECYALPVATPFLEGDYTITGFEWSPDGKKVLVNYQSNPLINSGITSDIGVVDVATKKMDTVVSNPTGDFFSNWSPDGNSFLYASSVNDSAHFYYKK